MNAEQIASLHNRIDAQIDLITDADDLNAIDASTLLDVLHDAQHALLETALGHLVA